MKRILYSLLLLTSLGTFAQVGIGTTTPAATTDITAQNPTGGATNVDGLLIPRVDRQRARSMAGTPTSTLIYVNNLTSTQTGQAANIDAVGFYYYDGAVWQKLNSGGVASNDWTITGNANTTMGTNFLGTTNAQGVDFRTNNTNRFRIPNGNQVYAMANGTAALPFYSWDADSNMGIYRINTDILGFSTNGAERFRVRDDGNIGVNSVGTASSQVTVVAAGTNDGVAAVANDNVANAFWGRNAHATGTAIIGATNGLGGIYPTQGAGVAGSAVNGYGLYASTGNGAPNNTAHAGNAAGGFTLDSDNNSNTNNNSANAMIAGKEVIAGTRTLFGGYFAAKNGAASTAYAYVGVNYGHGNNGNATGGTDYKILGSGTVSTIIKDNNNTPRIMFAPEAPEVLFQDFGVGQLKNGVAEIKIDETIAKNIKVDNKRPLKVFIQLEGDCNGVYVTNKSVNGFTVKELQNGNSNVSFSWQIVANRADTKDANGEIISNFENLRLPIGPTSLKEKQLSSKKMERKE